MKFVYCAVRTKSLNIIQVIFGFNVRVMARTVSRRRFTVKTRVRSQTRPRKIRGRQSGTRTCLRVHRLSNVSNIPPMHHTLLHLRVPINRRTKERRLGTFPQAMLCPKSKTAVDRMALSINFPLKH